MNKGLWETARQWIGKTYKEIDPTSWPAFFMFAVVLAAAGSINYSEMAKIVDPFSALGIASLFGIGVLAWHIVESRTDDSKFQEDVAQIAKWMNVALDGILLVINLFRAELATQQYDIAAFVIIGISATSHVVCYLLWTQNDPRRINRKELERGLSEVKQRGERSIIQIKKTEERLSKLKWIVDEKQRLHQEYDGVLPPEQVNKLINDMEAAAMREMDDVQPQDIQPTRAQKPIQRQMTANASTTVGVQPKDNGNQSP